MHISDMVTDELVLDGWDDRAQDNGDVIFYKRLPTGGAFGEAIVTLRMDHTGRWLERVDGWGTVERDVDLREYISAEAAIEAVLS